MLLSKCLLSNNRLDNFLLSKQTLGNFYLDGEISEKPRFVGIDEYTKIMLHFNGVDGSTTFTDETGRTWGTPGYATIKTNQSKFGGASVFFDGNGYIYTPDSADFTLGSGDFTIDCWIMRNASDQYTNIFGQNDSTPSRSSTSVYATINNNKLIARVGYGNSSKDTSAGAGEISINKWHHIAVVRYGNELRTYLDGVLQGTADLTGITVNDSTNQFCIGRMGEYSSYKFKGWIDEFHFSKGIARWTKNFTPPTKEYTTK